MINNFVEISILIVNFNSSKFIEISLESLEKLTFFPYKVYLLDNNSSIRDFNYLKKVVTKYKNVFLERQETALRGSLAHGTALNYLVKKVQTPYFAILDADAIFLKRHWDQILINKLDDHVKVVGTQADKGSLKPLDFPLMFAILFETETFKNLKIDFRPKDIEKHLDTGFNLREKYLANNFAGIILTGKNTRTFFNGSFAKVLGVVEYYLEGVDDVFACHFGRGSMGKYKYSHGAGLSLFYQIPFLSRPLRVLKNYQERKKWINICQQIINKQINK